MKSAQQGFTLLELLVAFAIMALSLGVLYRASGQDARNVADLERYQKAVLLAESLLALNDSVPPQGWNQSGQSGDYVWQANSTPYATPVQGQVPGQGSDIPPLHEVHLSVRWGGADQPRQIDLYTLRPERKPTPPEGTQP